MEQSPLGQGGAAKPRGSEARAWGPRFAKQTLGFMGGAHEWRWPRRLTSAPASTDTVAAFRPWRGFRSSVARGRRGHHRRCVNDAAVELAVNNHEGDSLATSMSLALRAASPCGSAILPIRRTRGGSHPLSLASPDACVAGRSRILQIWRREGDTVPLTLNN
jgi:hypothetical protein